MTSFTRQSFQWPGASKEQFARDAIDYLHDSATYTENVIADVTRVEGVLGAETDQLLADVNRRAAAIKEMVDVHCDTVKRSIVDHHENNMARIQELRRDAEIRLDKIRTDIEKLQETQNGDQKVLKPLVNKVKVVGMVMKSVDKSRIRRNVKIVRTSVEPMCDVKVNDIVGLFGPIQYHDLTVLDVLYPLKLVNKIKTADEDVNCMAINNSVPEKVWVCGGAGTKIIGYKPGRGKPVTAAMCDFRVDDMLVTDDGRLIYTSPDSTNIHCWLPGKRPTGSVKSPPLVHDSLHLHGITDATTSGVMAVCGTDKPNYSDEKPNETVIIELTLYGKEVKRIMISGYSGKAYRIGQNINKEFVVTFPKEGMILSVDPTGKIKSSFSFTDFKKCDIPICTNNAKETGNDKVEFWPSGIACDVKGHVFVSDWFNKLVLMFDDHLNFLRCVGSSWSGPNALFYDCRVDELWIADKGEIQTWKTF